jgi:hypothetical protein
MFNETWLRNDEFFFVLSQFYDGLNDYYAEYQINLGALVRKLLVDLVRLFYNVFNTQTSVRVDDTCLDAQLDESLSLFEPLPSAVSVGEGSPLQSVIERLLACLESIKMLNAGLTRTRDMLIELYAMYEEQAGGGECVRLVAKMSVCSMCVANGETTTTTPPSRPCVDSCLAAYKKCVNIDFAQLDVLWSSYIGMKS